MESESTETKAKKRPFNKKKWREQKYGKRPKIEEWEERRRKAALYKYKKQLRKENPNFVNAQSFSQGQHEVQPKKNAPRKLSAYQRAVQEYQKKREEKQRKKEEAMKRNAERKEALERYRVKKMERNKKLSKKTQKGQPIMKDRLELLLEKIQQEM